MPSVLSSTDSPPHGSIAGLMLVEEISHRVLNDYTRAIARLRMAVKSIEDPEARALVIELAQNLQADAHAHRVLQAPQRDGAMDLGGYLKTVCAALTTSALEPAGVRLTFVEEQAQLPADQCWRMGLVVAELVLNAARHGLKWSAGQILVELALNGTDILCRVSSANHGETAPSMGRGRRLICALMAEMGGRVEWIFTPVGVCAVVQLPRDGD